MDESDAQKKILSNNVLSIVVRVMAPDEIPTISEAQAEKLIARNLEIEARDKEKIAKLKLKIAKHEEYIKKQRAKIDKIEKEYIKARLDEINRLKNEIALIESKNAQIMQRVGKR